MFVTLVQRLFSKLLGPQLKCQKVLMALKTNALKMEFSNDGVTAYFHIIMSPEGFGIELDNVVFENPQDDEADTRQLIDALNNARLKKSTNK